MIDKRLREKIETFVASSDYFVSKESFDGRVKTFSYNIVDYEAFKDKDIREIRGISFVGDRKFYTISKFFNVNEIEETQFSRLLEKEIDYVAEKLDGSMISFIELDNEIIPKSKFSFESDQVVLTKKVLNDKIIDFVKYCFSINLHPIFEIVSPENRIVLRYDETKLVLTAVRDDSGEYLNFNDKRIKERINELEHAKYYPCSTIKDVEKLINTMKDIEGFVIKFKDGQMVKFKTEEYFRLHKIFSDFMSKKAIFNMIADNTLDDALSTIECPVLREQMKELKEIFDKRYFKIEKEVEVMMNSYNRDIKEFAIKNQGNIFKSIGFNIIRRGTSKHDAIISYMKNSFGKKESDAIEFFRDTGL